MTRRPPSSPLFPYTPLSRSHPRHTQGQRAGSRGNQILGPGRGQTCGAGPAKTEVLKNFAALKSSFTPPDGTSAFSTLAKDRKSTRLNSSHGYISYAVFCLKK